MSKPKNREEFRNQMAEAFINILSERGLEWKKEWTGTGSTNMNAVTKAPYKGINALNLYLTARIRGYDDVRWATMVQIADKDRKYHPNEKWHLKAGSKATYVEYWYQYDTVNKKAVTWKQYRDEILNGRPPEAFRLCSRYTPVFNASDIEGIPKLELEVKENRDINIDEIVTKLSENMKVPIFEDGGDRAYYSPANDEIHLPKKEYFTSEYAFNATALHELSHSTGHATRLNRALGGFFGSESYAYEELVAEMCACFTGINLNSVPDTENHKAYVQSWIREIKEKPDALVRAVKDAQAAALYMDFNAELITREEYVSKTNGVYETPAAEANHGIANGEVNNTGYYEESNRFLKEYGFDAFKVIAAYEDAAEIPHNEQYARWYGDYGVFEPSDNMSMTYDALLSRYNTGLKNLGITHEQTTSVCLEFSSSALADKIRSELKNTQSDIGWQKLQTIYEYESSVNRDEAERTVIQDPLNGNIEFRHGISQAQIDETYNKCLEYLRFGNEVESVISGELDSRNAVKVCDTPVILQAVGCEDLPMLYTQRHLKNAMRDRDIDHPERHGLKKEQIKKIPELLETPVMIYDSLTRDDSVVAVLSETDNYNMPIVVSIRPNGQGQYNFESIENNFITSIYGRSKVEEHFRKIIESGKLLFIDKKRSQALCNLLQVQFPQGLHQSDFNCIILKTSNIVKQNISERTTKPRYGRQTVSERTSKPHYDKQKLKEIPIADIAEALGIEVIRQNGSAWCKIRDEQKASCKLYETTNSFCDFGSMAGGDTINFVKEVTQADTAQAMETLANLFNIEPERGTRGYTAGLSNSQYAKIGIAGEMATMNMDIDIEKTDIDEVKKLTEPYRITMNELRTEYPEKYAEIMRKRAIPFIYSERQDYYSAVWSQDMLCRELNVDLKLSPNSNGEFRLKATELNNKERLMLLALKGTDIGYKPRKYDFEKDIEKIRTGKIQFEVGNTRYNALKRSEASVNDALDYKSVSVGRFLESKPNLEKVDYAAFVKGDSVNLAFRKSDRRIIEEAIKAHEKTEDKQKSIKR